jgi:predicted nucleic acid-binding protein
MLYLDTSFVTPIVLPEATSVSHWTRIEFAGLVARRVRMRELRNEHAAQAMVAFERLLADSFLIILPTLSDFNLAIELLNYRKSGLRSGDALHLAIARNRGAEFFTLDKKLIRAARSMGITAASGISFKSN